MAFPKPVIHEKSHALEGASRHCQTMMRVALIGLMGIVVAGCGSNSSSSFAGKWNCTTVLTDALVGSYTYNASWTCVDLGNDEISLREDDIQCPPVRFKVSGDSATLEPGQTCTASDGTQISYVIWQATTDGTTLTMDSHYGTQVGPGERQSTCHR
jgi:hypothetical protein